MAVQIRKASTINRSLNRAFARCRTANWPPDLHLVTKRMLAYAAHLYGQTIVECSFAAGARYAPLNIDDPSRLWGLITPAISYGNVSYLLVTNPGADRVASATSQGLAV